MSSIINVYKTYSFKNKDPIIDELRTIIKDEGATYNQIHEASGVSTSCLVGWFDGATRRPQNATIEAVARSLGYERRLVRVSAKQFAKKK